MVVGVYGVGYLIAAADPVRHWPIVFVGLLGKVLGPLGFLSAATRGDLPWVFGVTIMTNDLIWWFPFAAILVVAWRTVPERDGEREETTREDGAWEIDFFYDGDCPFCKREVALFRRLDRKRKIKLTDIAAPDFHPSDIGTDMSSLMAEIHARLPDRTWLRGVEVFRRVYSAVRLGWIVPVSRLPLISHALDLCYRFFAKHRLRLTGRCSLRGCFPSPHGEPRKRSYAEPSGHSRTQTPSPPRPRPLN